VNRENIDSQISPWAEHIILQSNVPGQLVAVFIGVGVFR
jgi:hypothetical protein